MARLPSDGAATSCNRPTRLSRLQSPTRPLDRPLRRLRLPPSAAVPPAARSVVKLSVLQAGALREWEGDAAIAEIPKALTRRGARLWIDVRGADSDLKYRISRSLGLHPLLART